MAHRGGLDRKSVGRAQPNMVDHRQGSGRDHLNMVDRRPSTRVHRLSEDLRQVQILEKQGLCK